MEIVTGSRLHFGLLHVPSHVETGESGIPVTPRSFGGAGLMIAEPELRIEARPAAAWSAEGPCAETIIAYAESCRRMMGPENCRPLTFRCRAVPPRHAGFGSGTQMGLAVARLIAETSGRSDLPTKELARWVQRGKRSAIGAYGFAEGGFLVEAGKREPAELSTLITRHSFPENWPIVIVHSFAKGAIHGLEESSLCNDLQNDRLAIRNTEVLCRILFMEVIPALIERDYQAFGQGLYEFNRQAGERFAKVQGGVFASGQTALIVETLRRESGCLAVGQSSWGPAVYAVCGDEEEAARLAVRARQIFYPAEVFITHAANQGALLRQAFPLPDQI